MIFWVPRNQGSMSSSATGLRLPFPCVHCPEEQLQPRRGPSISVIQGLPQGSSCTRYAVSGVASFLQLGEESQVFVADAISSSPHVHLVLCRPAVQLSQQVMPPHGCGYKSIRHTDDFLSCWIFSAKGNHGA